MDLHWKRMNVSSCLYRILYGKGTHRYNDEGTTVTSVCKYSINQNSYHIIITKQATVFINISIFVSIEVLHFWTFWIVHQWRKYHQHINMFWNGQLANAYVSKYAKKRFMLFTIILITDGSYLLVTVCPFESKNWIFSIQMMVFHLPEFKYDLNCTHYTHGPAVLWTRDEADFSYERGNQKRTGAWNWTKYRGLINENSVKHSKG